MEIDQELTQNKERDFSVKFFIWIGQWTADRKMQSRNWGVERTVSTLPLYVGTLTTRLSGTTNTDLEGIHQILDEKQAAHLLEQTVDVGQTEVHMLAESLRRQGNIFFHQSPVTSI